MNFPKARVSHQPQKLECFPELVLDEEFRHAAEGLEDWQRLESIHSKSIQTLLRCISRWASEDLLRVLGHPCM